MSDHSLLQWDRLPQDPLGFFGLEKDFERRDLKRAYGRLIRQFKPETHPQEFQKIREAYEQLESANRYGIQKSLAKQQSAAWSNLQQSNQETKTASTSVEQSKSILEQAVQKPNETYKRLSGANQRSAQDYYILAILSDFFDDKAERTLFAKWILKGLKEHPKDPGLQAVLSTYLNQDLPDKQAASMLAALANVLLGEDYFRMTESVWDRMLRQMPFDRFAILLEKCQQSIRRESPFHNAAFHLHLLKQAIWKAPPEWFEEKYESVLSLGLELEANFAVELEFLDALKEYFHTARKKIQDDELLKKIDNMIRDYCQSDWSQGATTASQVLDEIGRSSFAVMKAFPNSEDAVEGNLLMLCHLIIGEVEEWTHSTTTKLQPRKMARQASQTVRDLRDTLEPVMGKINRMHWRSNLIYVVCPALVPMVLLWGYLSFFSLAGVFVIAAVIAYCVYRFVLLPSFLNEKLEAKQQKIFQSFYNAVWRPRLFRYIQSNGTRLEPSLQKLMESGSESGDDEWLSAVVSYSYTDGGLALFARSQSFVG